MAQVMLKLDLTLAKNFAISGIGKIIDLAQAGLETEIPWLLRDVPILALAYEQGCKLGIRIRAAAEARTSALQKLEEQAPDATIMLASIQAGKIIKLNCHSLGWDINSSELMGTNAYGVDYYWGEVTLESVERWRTMMITGEQLGIYPTESNETLENGPIDWITETMHQIMDSALQQYIEQYEMSNQ